MYRGRHVSERSHDVLVGISYLLAGLFVALILSYFAALQEEKKQISRPRLQAALMALKCLRQQCAVDNTIVAQYAASRWCNPKISIIHLPNHDGTTYYGASITPQTCNVSAIRPDTSITVDIARMSPKDPGYNVDIQGIRSLIVEFKLHSLSTDDFVYLIGEH